MNRILRMIDRITGMVNTQMFSVISIPRYWQIKSTANVMIIPTAKQPTAR